MNRWTRMVDAAMEEMRNITPPLRRSECERLIRAALGGAGSGGMHVQRFDCSDGTHHFSVVEDDTDELSTCVMHDTLEGAMQELEELASASALPKGRMLPHPASLQVSDLLESLLDEYQWPANSKNAARAGWEAANRWLLLQACQSCGGTREVFQREFPEAWAYWSDAGDYLRPYDLMWKAFKAGCNAGVNVCQSCGGTREVRSTGYVPGAVPSTPITEAYPCPDCASGVPDEAPRCAACRLCGGSGRYGDGANDGSGRWIECPNCASGAKEDAK
jgi:hypothetical protein